MDSFSCGRSSNRVETNQNNIHPASLIDDYFYESEIQYQFFRANERTEEKESSSMLHPKDSSGLKLIIDHPNKTTVATEIFENQI